MRLILLFLLLPALGQAAEGMVKRYVTQESARLLEKPAAFSKAKAKLSKGQALMVVENKNGYARVSLVADGLPLKGWVSQRALATNKPRFTAKATRSKDASAEEVAAATKGFNKQVEAGLREEDKAGGYAKLDTALARTDFKGASLEDFRQQGKLGEFKGGAE